jgi:superfamily II DNA helicase RecQ
MSHGQKTHSDYYFSVDMTEEDQTNRSWWVRFGADLSPPGDPDSNSSVRRDLEDFELLNSLRSLLGDANANWKSDKQLQACKHSANATCQHSLVGLECGEGKSMTWLVPLLARKKYNQSTGATLVICPQTILLHQHLTNAASMLSSSGIQIRGYTDGDLEEGVPEGFLQCVQEKGLVFVTLNAWSTIACRHRCLVKTWIHNRGVERVIVDEFHLLYDEFGIRAPEYLSLRYLVALKAPIHILSATLPPKLRSSAEKFLGLDGNATRIGGDSYRTPDVSVNATKITQEDIVEKVSQKVADKLREADHRAVHVVSLFASTGKEIAAVLDQRGVKCELVTSTTTNKEKARISKEWCEGVLKVLVSTTGCGLDSSACGCVIVAVGAWSIMSLVQYLGRIRKARRGRNATMDVLFVSDLGNETWERFKTDASLNAERMLNNGLIESREDYLAFCTPMAMKEWVMTTECRMAAALSRFGGSTSPCGRCDNCLKGCDFTTKSGERADEMDLVDQFKVEGRKILAALQANCLVCRDPFCDGKGVGDYSSYVKDRSKMCNKGCFHCGKTGDWDHKSGQCAARPANYIRNLRFCYCCLGPWVDTGGLGEHREGKCKLKGRLQRLYIWCYHNEKRGASGDNGEDFKAFMIEHFSNPQDWYRKLVMMCRKNGLT